MRCRMTTLILNSKVALLKKTILFTIVLGFSLVFDLQEGWQSGIMELLIRCCIHCWLIVCIGTLAIYLGD